MTNPEGDAAWPETGGTRPEAGGDEHAKARDLAYKRIKAKRDFQAHLFAYVVVNAFLIGVWAFTGRGYFWPMWVLAGWGIGVVFNAWDVFWRRPITEAEIDAEMRRRG